jgi:hypothetical protein
MYKCSIEEGRNVLTTKLRRRKYHKCQCMTWPFNQRYAGFQDSSCWTDSGAPTLSGVLTRALGRSPPVVADTDEEAKRVAGAGWSRPGIRRDAPVAPTSHRPE